MIRILTLAMLGALVPVAAAEEAASERPLVLAHMMPWFEAKPSKGEWGHHWTMGKRDPRKGEVAAHVRPLIGLYDSTDPEVVEHQLALMKASGIDGVIVDWYGPGGFANYAHSHRATALILEKARKLGLRFSLCLEDQIGDRFLKEGRMTREQATAKVAEAFAWADRNWFGDPAFLRLSGRPIALVFGPQYLTHEEWAGITAGLRTKPLILGLPHLSKGRGLEGSFAWVPAGEGGNWKAWLKSIVASSSPQHPVMAVAFPGFHDYYSQAGLGPSFGKIEHRDGRTMEESLEFALRSGSPIVQVATWNDYGEGTVIEPTAEHGHRYLEIIMRRLRPEADPAILRKMTEDFLRRR